MMPNVTRGDRMAGLLTYLVGGGTRTTSTRNLTWWPVTTR